jgi:hypothetical protein
MSLPLPWPAAAVIWSPSARRFGYGERTFHAATSASWSMSESVGSTGLAAALLGCWHLLAYKACTGGCQVYPCLLGPGAEKHQEYVEKKAGGKLYIGSQANETLLGIIAQDGPYGTPVHVACFRWWATVIRGTRRTNALQVADIVIDDGSHNTNDQVQLLMSLSLAVPVHLTRPF